jgi:hypothetical protein
VDHLGLALAGSGAAPPRAGSRGGVSAWLRVLRGLADATHPDVVAVLQ